MANRLPEQANSMKQQKPPKSLLGSMVHGAMTGAGTSLATTPLVNKFWIKKPLTHGLGSGVLYGGIGGALTGALSYKLEENERRKGKKPSGLVKALPAIAGIADDLIGPAVAIARAKFGKAAHFEFGLDKIAFGEDEQ